MQSSHHRNRLVTNLVVIASFVILTIVLTYPVITTIRTEAAGLGSDSHQTFASILNTFNRFKDLGIVQSLWTTLIHLNVDPVTIHTYLMKIFGFPLGYNVFWMFSYVASGFGAFLLTRHVIRSTRTPEQAHGDWPVTIAAIVAGFLYAFTPAHVAWSMGFRGATQIEWIPFATLFILKFFEKPTTKNLVGAGVFFLLLIRGESHFAAGFLLFAVPLIIYAARRNAETVASSAFRRRALVAGVIGTVVLFTVYSPLIRTSVSENNYLNPGIGQTIAYSNDVLSIVTPPFTNTLFGETFASLREAFTGNRFESSAYVGFTALFFLVLVFTRRAARDGRFWVLTGLSLYVLSIGPFLHFHGLVEPLIPMPYLIVHHTIPFFANIRSVDRIAIFAILAIAVAVGYGLTAFLARYRSRVLSLGILPILVFGLLLVEYFPAPVPTTSVTYPAFYDQLKNDSEEYAILEIPGATNYQAASRFSYYQAIHRKDMINFYQPARVNTQDERYRRMVDTPLYRELLFERVRNSDLPAYSAFDMTNPDVTTTTLNADHVRYIIIHKDSIGDESDELSSSSYADLRSFLDHDVITDIVEENSEMVVYEVGISSDQTRFDARNASWDKMTTYRETLVRKVISGSTLPIVHEGTPGPYRVTFDATTMVPTGATLTVSANGAPVGRFDISDRSRSYGLFFPALASGTTTLTFDVAWLGDPIDQPDMSPTVGLSSIALHPVDQSTMNELADLAETLPAASLLTVPFNGFPMVSDPSPLISYAPFLTTDGSGVSPEAFPPFVREVVTGEILSDDGTSSSSDVIDPGRYRLMEQSVEAQFGLRSILVYVDELSANELVAVDHAIRSIAPETTVDRYGMTLLYHLPATEPSSQIVLSVDNGWDQLEIRDDGAHVRKVREPSTMTVRNRSANTLDATLTLDARSCPDARNVLLTYLDDTVALTSRISTAEFTPLASPIRIPPGAHRLSFVVMTNTGEQVDPRGNCAVWVRNISVTDTP